MSSNKEEEKAAVVVSPEAEKKQLHPLHWAWTMYYNPASKSNNSKSWTSNVRPIWTFSTVEDFWKLFNNLVPPSRLPIGSNYHMFKSGIQPEWEDAANKEGGKWSVMFPQKGEENCKRFDEAWAWTVLALIGEFFEDSDNITGVVISPRAKINKIALWTADARNKPAQIRIGNTWKQNLNIASNLTFQSHDDARRDRRSSPTYSV